MDDEPDRPFCVGDGSPLSLGSLARMELQPDVHNALYEPRERFDLATREHLLARITPRERVFIEYVCLHPDQTDEQVMAALGLRESTVMAYYSHLNRNFHVRTSSELRRWASKNQLVNMPAAGPNDPPVDPPVQDFDPWVRWY